MNEKLNHYVSKLRERETIPERLAYVYEQVKTGKMCLKHFKVCIKLVTVSSKSVEYKNVVYKL